MKRQILVGWVLGSTAALPGNAAPPEARVRHRADLVAPVAAQCDARRADWLKYYTDLHRNPELSLQEKESARKIAERLASAGYKVTSNVGGYGVVGVLANGPGPTVLIRGDMDALPVEEETGLAYRSQAKGTASDGRAVSVMHACGHDIHQTCLVGTAEVLAQLKDKWSGTIVAIAQPAEEIGVGALAMIKDGLFERFPKPDVCISLHVSGDKPAGHVEFTPGWAAANADTVDITIFGRGGHGSRPEATIDPIVAAAHVVTALQTIVSRRVTPGETAVVTVGSIHAGSKHNIIASEAKLQLTVRSYTDETRKLLLDGIREVTVNTARGLGCVKDPEIRVSETEFTPAGYNDPQLTEAGAEIFRQLLGAEHVSKRKPMTGAEDFGRYAKHLNVPGFMFWLGSIERGRFESSLKPGADPLPTLHSSLYYPDPEPTIATGVKCLTALALGVLDEKRP